ncbi:hypothetical protein BS50DRAFT_306964 [Corynespora cassiicola Philippines]|uniref:Extensin domain-containing protein n=1 Tax=Corynespora cassiicola Philippines TaxID=1448308 RepID=A0A2T2NY16_CORCC|nr:hypothetical protein BS50DRAFT_306964 [Corynespora cassiicola Philippines]
MPQSEHNHAGRHGTREGATIQNFPRNMTPVMSLEEELLADVDEPPDLERTPRPSALKLHDSFKASFSKTAPSNNGERKLSLLTSALHSTTTSPVEEHSDSEGPSRGLSCASTWSSHSASTAELTSDGGFTSPGTRTSTPSPPLPSAPLNMVPIFNKKPFDQRVSIMRHDDDNIGPLQKAPAPASGEDNVEASLGRKRCIMFACGPKDAPKPPKPAPSPKPAAEEPPKRVCTIKFACPTKISTDAPSQGGKPRRAASPAPTAHRLRSTSKASPKIHRDSDSTVRNPSPVSVRKQPPIDRSRRLSTNSDLARSEAYRFHEFASSEEEVDEWLQESTCHRSRLTIKDTLKIENNLRQLGEEAEEEALEDEEEDMDDADDDDDDDVELEDDDDDILDEDDDDDQDEESDEGFQTDDEDGFAVSDDESDAGSDFNWWAPGASTAATSMEHIEHIRPSSRRSVSESSVGSVESANRFTMPERHHRRRKSKPLNIRVPSPELPDSTDFVCGTLDEDRPLEAAYMSCLERRRAAKHKVTPQDIDPTFPASDPEMDEEDEDDDDGAHASESDQHLMMHGQMEPHDIDLRGRSKNISKKRSPLPSPRRLRSPPPAKRTVHRSPPPRKLFGNSPRRARSPAPVRLRSPPPTRRGSSNIMSPRRDGPSVHFVGLAERPPLTTSSSLPRTPITAHQADYDEDDTCSELPVRRAIDIKIGLENKRQRRKEQLYKKLHRKGAKDKRPPPGKGCERMREMGLGLAAHRGKAAGLPFQMPPTPDQKDMHVLSV